MSAVRTLFMRALLRWKLQCALDDLHQHRAIAGPEYRRNVRAHIAALRVELAGIDPHAALLREI